MPSYQVLLITQLSLAIPPWEAQWVGKKLRVLRKRRLFCLWIQDETPIVGVRDQVPTIRVSGPGTKSPQDGLGDPGHCKVSIKLASAQIPITIFSIAEMQRCVWYVVVAYLLLLRSKLGFQVQILLGATHPLNYFFWVHSHPYCSQEFGAYDSRPCYRLQDYWHTGLVDYTALAVNGNRPLILIICWSYAS